MRAVAEARLPTIVIVFVALVGIAVSVAIGRALAPEAEPSTSIACGDCIESE